MGNATLSTTNYYKTFRVLEFVPIFKLDGLLRSELENGLRFFVSGWELIPQSDCLHPQSLHCNTIMSLVESETSFDRVEEAIAEIAAGRPVIVTDDESRENEGDLIVAASKITRKW